jgi:hypothetical protein
VPEVYIVVSFAVFDTMDSKEESLTWIMYVSLPVAFCLWLNPSINALALRSWEADAALITTRAMCERKSKHQ